MLKKILPLTMLPLLAFAQPAEARRLFWWEQVNPELPAPPPPYQEAYGAPYDDQSLYGYGPDEQFNEREYQLYRHEMQRRYRPGVELEPPRYTPPRVIYSQPEQALPYAAPVYSQPKVKKYVKAKPVVAPAPVVQVTPITKKKVATIAPKASTASKPSTVGVTCEKGATIVSGFGFENVKTKTCEAGTLAYSAERSGQPFEIDVNPKTGELIAVKKIAAGKTLSDKVEKTQPNPTKAKEAATEI